jgi:hypothetical protein
MGGGEVVGGGDSALSSGWTPATGQWPTRDQALRTPPNWNVVDWANGKLSPPGGTGSSSDREKKSDRDVPRSRAASKSRAPSRAASGHEIFIPDSGDEGDGWLQGNDTGGSYRGPSPQPGAGQSSVRSQQWIYLNPNHAPNTTRPSSRQRSPDPYNGIYGPPSKGKGMGSTLGGPLKAFEYGPPPHDSRSGHNRTPSHVVPTSFHDYHDPDHERKVALRHAQAEKLRKKKEKERKRTKEIGKARSSKWAPRNWLAGDAPAGINSDTDDSEESDESTDEDDDVDNDRRAREKRGGKASSSGRGGHRHHDQVHEANGWHAHTPFNVPHAATPGAASLHPPAHFQPSASRPVSRNASPSRMKKRPPPLAISPPPVPVIPAAALQHTTAANPARSGHPNGTIPARLGAAERAQYQFEQQQRDYHQQLVKQSYQPTVKEVAHRVAEQVAAQQTSVHPHAHPQAQQASHHAQRLRGAASWAQPHQPVVVGSHQQSWYHQQQHIITHTNQLRGLGQP